MNPLYFQAVVGVLILIPTLSMLGNKRSAKIRKSRVWYLYTLLYLLGLSLGGAMVAPVVDMVLDAGGITDAQAVPALGITMVVAILVVLWYQLYKSHREVRHYKR